MTCVANNDKPSMAYGSNPPATCAMLMTSKPATASDDPNATVGNGITSMLTIIKPLVIGSGLRLLMTM
ncbi:hypothetical protein N7471_011662 [Penicillium samsonianum]|uniref:uncharacterized protein n=1 Tax=Penicillium samsonianum TaxID=1882272 RepID=UPI002549A41E|nr:uncharacterized protein N7471_011662 [Penicillium samsonianum]KAJ6124345.1 hypothetical protein N7471_011662 [Penicillium samsonianum]